MEHPVDSSRWHQGYDGGERSYLEVKMKVSAKNRRKVEEMHILPQEETGLWPGQASVTRANENRCFFLANGCVKESAPARGVQFGRTKDLLPVRLLAAVCFAVLIGLIGADFGQAAQTHISNTKVKPAVTMKQAAVREKTKQHHMHATKKTTSVKLKIKARHASSSGAIHHKKTRHARLMHKAATVRKALASSPPINSEAMANDERSNEQCIDLWLAKAYAERCMQGTDEEQLDELTRKILESAQSYLGVPYRYGGSTPEGFDCSGFVKYVFGENGITLSRTSREQVREGKHVPLSAVRPGDLIFFGKQHRKHCRINHVGLYIGNGRFIHASSAHSGQIKIGEIDLQRHRTRLVTARRVINYTP
jgi:cell wall-associated NlpC family hydrolase